MAEESPSPALLLNVPPHSAISDWELKLCSFPLLRGSKHHRPSSWLCLTPNSAVWDTRGAPVRSSCAGAQAAAPLPFPKCRL